MKRWRMRCGAAVLVSACAWAQAAPPVTQILRDEARGREVPVWLDEPAGCSVDTPCPVVLLSPGWGLPATGYRFLVERLVRAGYAVVAVQDQLPGDPPMPNTGDLQRDRGPYWRRGAATLRFVQAALLAPRASLDARRVVLLGHSHGGDVSATLAAERPAWVVGLVTLDHRRVPLPRASDRLRVLSLRGSDFTADPGVLPAGAAPGLCVLHLRDAPHNDMHDGGPARLKDRLADAVGAFLSDGRCEP